MKSIALKDVVKNYYLGEVVVPALKSVNLNISSGEFTVIAGPSGSGKTTLLNLVGCVDTATAGIVSVGDEDTAKLSERKLTDLRLHTIGFIFQNFNLISVLNVYDNVEFFFFQAEDGIRDWSVTGVQTCALPICTRLNSRRRHTRLVSDWSSDVC